MSKLLSLIQQIVPSTDHVAAEE